MSTKLFHWTLTIQLLFAITIIRAQTIVPSGDVSGVWTVSNSPYQVQGLIVVQDFQTLTIEPGVTIQFAQTGRLQVKGNIIANGMDNSPITMTELSVNNGWHGVYLDTVNVASDSSIFFNCIFEDAIYGLLNVHNFNRVRVEACVFQDGASLYGGGLEMWNCNGIIRNNLFQNNSASNSGGGIHVAGGSPTIIGNTFLNNYASLNGGGLSTTNYANCLVVGNTFINNDAYAGGALAFFSFGNSQVVGNHFNGNTSFGYGAGAIVCSSNDPLITDNTFLNNSTSGDGGACYFTSNADPILTNNYFEGNHGNSGGACYIMDDATGTFSQNTFVNNDAGNGAAIHHWGMTTLTVDKCEFSNNVATSRGGAIFSSGSNVSSKITNCSFTNNRSFRGGAVSLSLGNSHSYTNCTFANNHATNDGGVLHFYSGTTPVFKNCIFDGNTSAGAGTTLVYQTGSSSFSSPSFINCNIEGGQSGFNLNGSSVAAYLNNIDSDPEFLSPSAGSGELFNGLTANWKVMSTSPCINAGTPDTTGLSISLSDLSGGSRVIFDTVDIGAYEYIQGPEIISQTSNSSVCSGDSVLLSISAVGDPSLTYQWQLDGTDIVGATDDSLLVYGTAINSGNYTCIASNGFGVDTSGVINVIYSPPPSLGSLGPDLVVCSGDTSFLIAENGPYSYTWNNGFSYEDSLLIMFSGNYHYSVTDMNSCSTYSDSIFVTVNPSPIFSLGADIEQCDTSAIWISPNINGVSYDWNNGQASADSINVNSTGTYILELTNAAGCSSLDTVDVTMHLPPIVDLQSDTLCFGETLLLNAGAGFVNYDWNNGLSSNEFISVQTSGDYFVAVIDSNNCSAMDTTFILFNQLPNISIGGDANICLGDSIILDAGSGFLDYDWNNGYSDSSSIVVSTPGQWLVEVTDVNGCTNSDSMSLIVSSETYGTDIVTECESFLWIDGNTYTSNNNSATYTLTNSQGCDSIVTLDLTILTPTTGTDIISACESYTWIDGTTYTASNNSATYTLVNAAGCDSVVTLDLTINTVNVTITNNDPELVAPSGMTSYQWLDCDDNHSPISGETNAIFVAQQNGTYAVQIEDNGCIDTSACTAVNHVGLLELSETNWTVYPNPTTGEVTIQFHQQMEDCKIEIVNPLGQTIQSNVYSDLDEVKLSLSEEPGLYFVTVVSESGSVRIPLVKI